ncbi:MAG: hypothetical protein HUU55_03415 [Myxococcales bacterium]|nr:hypothetical protein [Myxococcales bacterium]
MNANYILYALIVSTISIITPISTALADHGPDKVIMVVQTGTIRIHNSSDLPFYISMNSQNMGMVAAGDSLTLANTPIGTHQVMARYAGKANIPSQSFSVDVFPRQSAEVVLRVPFGELHVHNPNPFPMTLRVNGQYTDTVHAGATHVVRELLPGRYHLALSGPHGSGETNIVRIQPGETERWTAPVAAAQIRIHNDSNHTAMKVRLNGQSVGKILPGGTLRLDNLLPGRQLVEIRGNRGYKVTRTFDVYAAQTATWHVDVPEHRSYHPHMAKKKKSHPPHVVVVAKY